MEETYELLEAIDNRDAAGMREELGDILLQVVFHARLAEEEGLFALQEIIDDITHKLVSRHPHVFGTVEVGNAEAVIANWEALKAQEKKERTHALDGVSPGLPALMRGYKLQQKASKVGFDWTDAGGPKAKTLEEWAELAAAVAAGDAENTEEEFGDLLFALVNYGRHLGLEPETALNKANNKFRNRFNLVEGLVRASGKTWADFSLQELDKLWESAKKCDKIVKK